MCSKRKKKERKDIKEKKVREGEKSGKVVLRIKSMSWIPSGSGLLSGGYCTAGELKKKKREKEGGRAGSHGK